MDKISEVITNQGYVKYYNYGEIIKPVEFLEELQSKGIMVGKVFLKRDAEMDMQMGMGNYTIEELKKTERSLSYGSACNFILKTEFNAVPVEIHFSDNSKILYMITKEKKLELNSLYEKKNNGLSL